MRRPRFQQGILWLCLACFGLGATLFHPGVVLCIADDGSMRLEFNCQGESETGCPAQPRTGETEPQASSSCSDVSLGAAKTGSSRHSERTHRPADTLSEPALHPSGDSLPTVGSARTPRPTGCSPVIPAWRTVRIQV